MGRRSRGHVIGQRRAASETPRLRNEPVDEAIANRGTGDSVSSSMARLVALVCLFCAAVPALGAPPPLIVLTPAGTTQQGLPVLVRRAPGEVDRVLSRGFSGRLLRLYALEQEYLRRESGMEPEPAYLRAVEAARRIPAVWVRPRRHGQAERGLRRSPSVVDTRRAIRRDGPDLPPRTPAHHREAARGRTQRERRQPGACHRRAHGPGDRVPGGVRGARPDHVRGRSGRSSFHTRAPRRSRRTCPCGQGVRRVRPRRGDALQAREPGRASLSALVQFGGAGPAVPRGEGESVRQSGAGSRSPAAARRQVRRLSSSQCRTRRSRRPP